MDILISMTLAVIVGLTGQTPVTPEQAWADCVSSAVGTDASYFACDAEYTAATGNPADLNMADFK